MVVNRPGRVALLAALAAGCSPHGCSRDEAAPPDTGASAAVAPSVSAAPSSADSAALYRADADVVSHASMQLDGGGEVLVEGSVDGAALRAKHRARLALPTPVTVLQGTGPKDVGERLCQGVVPRRPKDTPVLLKPNIGGFDWFKDPAKNDGDDGVRGRITDPEFVRGVIRCLRARGHTKITIAEGWGATHKDWEHLMDVSGYAKMAAEEKVPLVAMDDDGVFDVQGEKPGKPLRLTGMEATHVPTLLIPKILAEHLEHGLFLSLPKIKAHRFGVVSVSVKGMQGTVMLSDASPAFRQKWRMHKELNKYIEHKKDDDRALYVSALETFADRIADVLEVEAPDAVLADGAPAMGGDGFQKLYPSAESFGVGGENPVLVDRIAAELLGLWDVPELARELGGHRTSPLIETAAKQLGIDLRERPAVVGDGIALLDAPRPLDFIGMAPFAIHRTTAGTRVLGDGGDESLPVAHAVHGDVVVDGRADDATWAKATPVTWDTDTTGHGTGIPTHARFAWSQGQLAMLFEVEATDLHVDAARPKDVERPRLYDEDCVEVFVAPDAAHPRRYYEMELGPLGHFFDIAVDRDASPHEDTTWSASLKIATSPDAAHRRAVIEAVTRAPEIVRALVSGGSLRLGLFRMEGKGPRSYLAWSPPKTKTPNFHVPEAFGSLRLDP